MAHQKRYRVIVEFDGSREDGYKKAAWSLAQALQRDPSFKFRRIKILHPSRVIAAEIVKDRRKRHPLIGWLWRLTGHEESAKL